MLDCPMEIIIEGVADDDYSIVNVGISRRCRR